MNKDFDITIAKASSYDMIIQYITENGSVTADELFRYLDVFGAYVEVEGVDRKRIS